MSKSHQQPASHNQPEKRRPLHVINAAMEHFSKCVTAWSGSSWAFGLALLVILIWVFSGPFFDYSNTWQLVINTGTTIVTFLMVFLIQRSQNKESLAVQLKLNELLAAQKGASNGLINVEDLSEEKINALHERFSKLHDKLSATKDDGASHSISEAREAVGEVQASLNDARQAVSDRKMHIKKNGHAHHPPA